mgnify:CR=1 FL=1
MAQLWGGRFTKELDSFVNDFNASILFDCRMFRQDIDGSIAHVTMLAEQGILTQEDYDDIIHKESVFRTETGTTKATHNVLVSANGVRRNSFSDEFQNTVTLDDLFE